MSLQFAHSGFPLPELDKFPPRRLQGLYVHEQYRIQKKQQKTGDYPRARTTSVGISMAIPVSPRSHSVGIVLIQGPWKS